MLIHATCVAFGDNALILRGPPGAGKSDLALRILGLAADSIAALDARFGGARLVADDQVSLARAADRLVASPPNTIRGLLEVRGLGIVRLPFVEQAGVRLIVDLTTADTVPRMPPESDTVELLGIGIVRRYLFPFEASAPLKCVLALREIVTLGPSAPTAIPPR